MADPDVDQALRVCRRAVKGGGAPRRRAPMGCSADILRPAAAIGARQRPSRQRHLRSPHPGQPHEPIKRIIPLKHLAGLTQIFDPHDLLSPHPAYKTLREWDKSLNLTLK